MTVAVGLEAIGFKVHEASLKARSPFFVSALSTAWKEGREGIVKLPEDRPETVELYLKHLYTGKLHIK